MGPERYLPFVPTILDWIQQTFDHHAGEKRTVASLKFPRLPQCYKTGRGKIRSHSQFSHRG
jgi:hypothetical protein